MNRHRLAFRPGQEFWQRLQPRRQSSLGRQPLAIGALRALAQIAAPIQSRRESLHSAKFLRRAQRRHDLMLRRHIHRAAIHEPRHPHRAFIHVQARRRRAGLHIKARAQHLQHRRRRVDEHRPAAALRSHIGGKIALAQMHLLLPVIRNRRRAVRHQRDQRTIAKRQRHRRIIRHRLHRATTQRRILRETVHDAPTLSRPAHAATHLRRAHHPRRITPVLHPNHRRKHDRRRRRERPEPRLPALRRAIDLAHRHRIRLRELPHRHALHQYFRQQFTRRRITLQPRRKLPHFLRRAITRDIAREHFAELRFVVRVHRAS